MYLDLKTAIIWLIYCRYGVKHHPINQSINWSESHVHVLSSTGYELLCDFPLRNFLALTKKYSQAFCFLMNVLLSYLNIPPTNLQNAFWSCKLYWIYRQQFKEVNSSRKCNHNETVHSEAVWRLSFILTHRLIYGSFWLKWTVFIVYRNIIWHCYLVLLSLKGVIVW